MTDRPRLRVIDSRPRRGLGVGVLPPVPTFLDGLDDEPDETEERAQRQLRAEVRRSMFHVIDPK